jgi:hypothetical protein
VSRFGALVAALCLGLAGCGNSRTPAPSLTRPATAGPLRLLSYPAAGVSFTAPRSWMLIPEPAPVVTVLASGGAVVSVWRYPLSGRAPAGTQQLEAARRSLIAATRARDRNIIVLGSRLLKIDGSPAIELSSIEQVDGQPRRSRATHVFAARSEIVVDEYAPVGAFGAVDAAVFAPLDHSLVISPSA